MADSSEKLIDAKLFWRALGQRAIGSTIVTARSEQGPAGFLGLSASHVSADPPLMLASIDKRTSALATVLAARHFAVNFLPREAQAIGPEREEDVHERGDFLEVQDILPRQPLVLGFGHAVFAAQVAPVGDRQPEVAERAPQRVREHVLRL